MSRTAVLVSGGVDSALALARLVAEGRPGLEAFYLKIWLEDEMAFLGRCPWEDDLAFVRQAVERLGVPLTVVSLQREYHERVVAEAVAELRAGRTPNPDVLCNRRVKLGAFLELVEADYRWVATGHHARLRTVAGEVQLHRGADPVKDQSYFLCLLDQAQLARALFPVGDLVKGEVRRQAALHALAAAGRPDSQGLCFLGRVPYADFVRCHLGERRGPIREHGSGRVLGDHPGIWFYTVGQRRGLGLAGGPWYVVGKGVEGNVVWVVHQRDRWTAARDRFHLAAPHWVGAPPADGARLEVRVRHGQRPAACRVHDRGPAGAAVVLDLPDPGLAPGQYAVLYDGSRCLGGGPIADEVGGAP